MLAGCLGNSGDPSPPPINVQPVVGDGVAGITWQPELGTTYLAFASTNAALTTLNWTDLGIAGFAILNGGTKSVPPALFCNTTPGYAVNGLPYYFAVDAHTGTAPGGGGSPTITAMPRPAGGTGTWKVGTPLGVNINAVGYAVLTTCEPSSLPTGIYAAVGNGGAIFTSSDSGKTWTSRTPPNYTTDLYGVATITFNANVSPTINLVAVGANGSVIRSLDGVTWTPTITGSPAQYALRAVGSTGTSFVAVGDNGSIEVSSNGATWAAEPSGTTANLHAVQCVSSVCIAVGDAETVDMSVDGGATWSLTTVGSGTSTLRGIAYGNFDNNETGSNQIGVAGSTSINTWVIVGDNQVAFESTTVSSNVASISWGPTPITGAANLVAISYTTQFVAIDSAGNAFASQTAFPGSWSTPVATGIPDPVSVVTNSHGYVLVGSAGDNASSF